jgi:hypothetical protein
MENEIELAIHGIETAIDVIETSIDLVKLLTNALF